MPDPYIHAPISAQFQTPVSVNPPDYIRQYQCLFCRMGNITEEQRYSAVKAKLCIPHGNERREVRKPSCCNGRTGGNQKEWERGEKRKLDKERRGRYRKVIMTGRMMRTRSKKIRSGVDHCCKWGGSRRWAWRGGAYCGSGGWRRVIAGERCGRRRQGHSCPLQTRPYTFDGNVVIEQGWQDQKKACTIVFDNLYKNSQEGLRCKKDHVCSISCLNTRRIPTTRQMVNPSE